MYGRSVGKLNARPKKAALLFKLAALMSHGTNRSDILLEAAGVSKISALSLKIGTKHGSHLVVVRSSRHPSKKG
jgi:hypothetical protein